ncbi:MAG: hypothetical protein IPG44_10100, partial [Anaerolineales bacterium]|nr:hypothetical protein [Anaerolineales bacterium]
HDEIAGALEAVKLASHYSGVEVIHGSEITTAEGDLLALFIHKKSSPVFRSSRPCCVYRTKAGLPLPHTQWQAEWA